MVRRVFYINGQPAGSEMQLVVPNASGAVVAPSGVRRARGIASDGDIDDVAIVERQALTPCQVAVLAVAL